MYLLFLITFAMRSNPEKDIGSIARVYCIPMTTTKWSPVEEIEAIRLNLYNSNRGEYERNLYYIYNDKRNIMPGVNRSRMSMINNSEQRPSGTPRAIMPPRGQGNREPDHEFQATNSYDVDNKRKIF